MFTILYKWLLAAALAQPPLANALANATTPAVAEAACADAWEEGGDAYHECVCSLEGWRCTVQGWCGDDRDRGPVPTPDPTRYWTSAPIEACE